MSRISPNKRLFIELPQNVPDLVGLRLLWQIQGTEFNQATDDPVIQPQLRIEPMPEPVTIEVGGATRTGVYVDLPAIPSDKNVEFRAAYYDDALPPNEPDLSPAVVVQVDREPPPKIENIYVVDAADPQ